MANLGTTFDPNAVPQDDNRPDFDLIPSSWQEVQIIESEVADTKAGDGKRLNLTLEIMTGPYERRKLWDGLNIQNPSDKAQAIAQRSLADICEATGSGVISDSEQLHFKPLMARVCIDPAKDGYGAKNVIKRYKAVVGAATAPQPRPNVQSRPSHAQPAQATPQPQQRAAAGAGSRPWGNR